MICFRSMYDYEHLIEKTIIKKVLHLPSNFFIVSTYKNDDDFIIERV